MNDQPMYPAPPPQQPYPPQGYQQPPQGYPQTPQAYQQPPMPPQQYQPQQPVQDQQTVVLPPNQQTVLLAPGQQPPMPPQPYQQPPGPQYPSQQYPPQQYPSPQPPEPEKKPKKKRGFWGIFFIVLFSPFIAIAYFFMGLYWVFLWLMTPVALVVHFALCAIGLLWYTPVKAMASGRSKHRILQPRYPGFPPFWTGAYWVRLRVRVKQTCEFAVALAQLLSP